ncbi:hypothetical protein AB9F29_11300 [Falsihalocynthiibacter sp. S25ZX9]
MNDDILRAVKSRIWRAGQLMIAIGSTVLIFASIFWLALRIIETQGMSV